MTALRLAPALLLVLAACVVKTDDLKPKTDADCAYAPGLKACGNRCMSRTDPANGCGNPGCLPCPTSSGGEAFCDGLDACALRPIPPLGFAYCDGPYDTFMEDLALNGSHCGACNHSCNGGTCSAGRCPPAFEVAVFGGRDVASDGFSLYTLAVDVPSYGQSQATRTTVNWTWSGRSTRLEADGSGIVAWDSALNASVWAGGVSGGTAIPISNPLSGSALSLALDPNYAYLVEAGGLVPGETPNDLVALPRVGGPALGYRFATETALTVVASEQPSSPVTNVVVGSQQRNLRWVSWDGSAEGLYASGVDVPVALVVFEGLVGPTATTASRVLFWLGASGSLFRKELPSGPVVTLVEPVATTSTYLDLYADADGVYWVDFTSGYLPFVAEWRAAHDDVVQLAVGDPALPPVRVTATRFPPTVYWMTVDGNVYSVPK